MAVKTWDTSLVGGGTYELHRDTTTGNYSLKSVGFDKVNKLNLPDLLTQDATTTTTTQNTNTTTGTTTDTAAPYKQLAQANLGDDTQPDYTKIPFTGGIDRGTDDTANITTEFPGRSKTIGGRDLSKEFPGRSRIDPTNPLDTVYEWDDAIMRGGKGATYQPKRNEKSIFVDDQGNMYKGGEFIGTGNVKSIRTGTREGTEFARPDAGTIDQMAADAAEFPGRSRTMGGPALGITPFGTAVDKEQGFTADSRALGITSDKVPDAIKSRQSAVPTKTTGLQKVKSKASNTLEKLKNLSPIKIAGKALGAVLGAITPERTPVQQLNVDYFNVRGGSVDGNRITRSQYVDRNGNLVTSSGNPANDLYAGFNRTSAYGNLERAGSKRLATRQKTIQKNKNKWSKEKMDKFVETTEKMKDQQKDYKKQKAAKQKATQGPAGGATTGGGGEADSGKSRVICTELHRTKEMATHDWIRDIKFTYKNLSKDHIKGYLFWAVPTVNLIKKYPTYRKIWKHLAQHRANDIAWRLNQGKFDLLGRIYAGIGEPLCWLIGKCVSDKQLKELKLNSWRRA